MENTIRKFNASLWWYNQTPGCRPGRGCNTPSPSDESRQKTGTDWRRGTPAICNYKTATSPVTHSRSTRRPLFQTLEIKNRRIDFNRPSELRRIYWLIYRFNFMKRRDVCVKEEGWPDFPTFWIMSTTKS